MPHYRGTETHNTDDKYGIVEKVDLYAKGDHNGPFDNLKKAELYSNPAHNKDSHATDKINKDHLVLIRD